MAPRRDARVPTLRVRRLRPDGQAMTLRAMSASRAGPARPARLEVTFPEAFDALSTAIREIGELRLEVSRLRVSTYLMMLSGAPPAEPSALIPAPADHWVAPRARRDEQPGSVRSEAAFAVAPVGAHTAPGPEPLEPVPDEDYSFDWAAWIQRLRPSD